MYQNELWTDVIGHENDYMISTYGRLFNKHTNQIKYPNDINSAGYPRHTMYYGKPDRQLAHRMVAIHFIPNPYNLPVVNHKDRNKLNPYVDNLEWTTYSENTQHYLNTEYDINCKSIYDGICIRKKNITPLVAVDIHGNIIEYYDSITQAAGNDDTKRVYIQRHINQYLERYNCTYQYSTVRFY